MLGQKSAFYEAKLGRMIDKLHLVSNNLLDPDWAHCLLQDLRKSVILDSMYQKCFEIKKNGKFIAAIKTRPRHENMNSLAIQLNPNSWEKFR